MKVMIFQRIVPHYRVPVFKALSKKLDIIICHGNDPSESFLKGEVKGLDFPNYRIKDWYLSNTRETLMVQDVLTPILKFRPKVVVAEFALGILSNWALLGMKRLLGFKLVFWSHGYSRKRDLGLKIQSVTRFGFGSKTMLTELSFTAKKLETYWSHI